jgi:protein-S-isoprenylcysteine O-methyltransferase Ste14
MKKLFVLIYGIVAYLVFLATFLYLIGFIGNLFVPKGIDGESLTKPYQAIVINLVLLSIFAVQHSVMARPWFKKWWTQVIPPVIERSTYLICTGIALIILYVFWQPVGGAVWSIENPFITGVLLAIFGLGWTIVLVSSFLINHFDLFGLRQVWLYFRGKPYAPLSFETPFLYKWVRHPLYFGLLLGFWAAPVMSVARLVLAVVWTAYVVKAISWEEKDLIGVFGEKYRSYRKRVPMIIPSFFSEKEKTPVYDTIIKRD